MILGSAQALEIASQPVQQGIIDDRCRVQTAFGPEYGAAISRAAIEFLDQLLCKTVDPRLRPQVIAILQFIAQGNYDAADRWLDRVLTCEEERRRLLA